MGAEVGPNHNAYRNSAPNITLFEVVNDKKWFPLDAWDNEYLKAGDPRRRQGGSDAHGRFSVKRGYRWCVWADRLSTGAAAGDPCRTDICRRRRWGSMPVEGQRGDDRRHPDRRAGNAADGRDER